MLVGCTDSVRTRFDGPRPQFPWSRQRPVVAFLSLSPVGADSLTEALGADVAVGRCQSVRDIERLSPGIVRVIVVVPMRDAAGMPNVALIEQIRNEYPSVAIVAHGSIDASVGQEVVPLVNAGVAEFAFATSDSAAPIRAAVARALVRRSDIEIRRAILELFPTAPDDVVNAISLERISTLTVSSLARGMRISRRTLVRRFERFGCQSPRVLLVATRLLAAAYHLGELHATVHVAALQSGFSSASHLRRRLRLLALRPRQLKGSAQWLPTMTRALSARVAGECAVSVASRREPLEAGHHR